MSEVEQKQAVPKRESQVSEQITHLEEFLGVLHDKIDRLTLRLSSALSAPTPPMEGTGKDRANLVPLAEKMQEFADSVRAADKKIGEIIERLEL